MELGILWGLLRPPCAKESDMLKWLRFPFDWAYARDNLPNYPFYCMKCHLICLARFDTTHRCGYIHTLSHEEWQWFAHPWDMYHKQESA
jgi:hypothetical protein